MRKKDVDSIGKLSEYYKKCRKIKFKNESSIDTTSTRSIIEAIIYKRRATTYNRGGHHCHDDKYRSVDDVFRIVKYYKPHLRVSKIAQEIIQYFLIDKNSGRLIHRKLSYCPDIKKTNFYDMTYAYPIKDSIRLCTFINYKINFGGMKKKFTLAELASSHI